jgi:hypothetical protein
MKLPDEINDLSEYVQSYTVGQLLDFIEKYNIPRDAKILVERIEDVYYEERGWEVVYKEGEYYHWSKKANEDMTEELQRRARGEKPKYDLEDPSSMIIELSNADKVQYRPIWEPIKYNDDSNLYLNLHF